LIFKGRQISVPGLRTATVEPHAIVIFRAAGTVPSPLGLSEDPSVSLSIELTGFRQFVLEHHIEALLSRQLAGDREQLSHGYSL
jgi:hypothetical protein